MIQLVASYIHKHTTEDLIHTKKKKKNNHDGDGDGEEEPDLWISTCSMSPENEKNSLISLSPARSEMCPT